MKAGIFIRTLTSLFAIVFLHPVQAQLINTVAGAGIGEGGNGRQVRFQDGGALSLGRNGDLLISDKYQLFRMAGSGIVTVLAGRPNATATSTGSAATASRLDGVGQTAVDHAGNIYVPDINNHRVRKITPQGVITTIAGLNGQAGFSGDGGTAVNAKLNMPVAVVVDSVDNIYISDNGNNRIRKIAAVTGTITTYAGKGTSGFSGDGAAAVNAELHGPYYLAIDRQNNIFAADMLNSRIRKITAATGIISTVAGSTATGFSGDGGAAINAGISVAGIAVDTAGNIVFCDFISRRIRRVTASDGLINTIAGNGLSSFPNGDGGPALNATMLNPSGIVADSSGNIYFHDDAISGVRKINASGIISTVAGAGITGANFFAGENNDATVSMMGPGSVVADKSGNIYVADAANFRIRKIDATGIITTVAGNGVSGYSGDGGPAINARFGTVDNIGLDGAGNIYIADVFNRRVRKIDAASGIITTVAGTGVSGFSGDGGAAIDATIGGYVTMAIDSAGNIYLAEQDIHRLRKVNTAGIISTIAGTGVASFSGDGGPATSATLNTPTSVAVDPSGNVYLADDGNRRIRKINGAGVISTVAGNGVAFNSGDGGPATSAGLANIKALGVDRAGNFYIGFFTTAVIRKVDAATGTISTVAGSGTFGYSGDGHPAADAKIGYVRAFTADTACNLYFVDNTFNLVRAICNSASLAADGAKLRWPATDTLTLTQELMDRCRSIIGLKSSGNYPLSTVTDFRVRVDSFVRQYAGAPYVQRHYDIEPLVFSSLYTGTFTFYFTQTEFDAYNLAAANAFEHLPAGPTDNVGIAAVRLTQYKGRGTAPGAYSGWNGGGAQTQVFTPQVFWNAPNSRWEVTIAGNAFGGFYLGTDASQPPAGVKTVSVNGFSLYPNPVSDNFFITSSDLGSLPKNAVLTDMQGRTIKTFMINNQQPVSVKGISPGIYLLRLGTDLVFRLIKQ